MVENPKEYTVVLSRTEDGFLLSKAGVSVDLTFCLQVNEQKDFPRWMRFRLRELQISALFYCARETSYPF